MDKMPEVSQAPPVDQPTKKSQFSWSAKLAMFIVLIVILGMGFIGFQLWWLNHETTHRLNEWRAVLNQTQQTLQKQHQFLQQNRAAIAQLTGDNSYWTQNEAKYFIRLAGLNLYLQRDARVSLVLLEMADNYLKGLRGSSVFKVRRLLAKNIEALKKAPKINTFLLYNRLKKVSRKLAQLQLVPERMTGVKVNPQSKIGWRKGLASSLQTLKGILIIRRHDQKAEPLISLKEKNALVLNLRVFIAQAQWALLQHQNYIYQSSLKTVRQNIARYFLARSQKTNQVLHELNALQAVNVSPKLPDMDQLFQAVQQLNSMKSKKIHKEG